MSVNQKHRSLFRLCCNIIVQAGVARNGKPGEKALNYAVGYAQAGLHLTTDEAIRVQILYILNNITHWRGDAAKLVRQDLKNLSHEYGN